MGNAICLNVICLDKVKQNFSFNLPNESSKAPNIILLSKRAERKLNGPTVEAIVLRIDKMIEKMIYYSYKSDIFCLYETVNETIFACKISSALKNLTK